MPRPLFDLVPRIDTDPAVTPDDFDRRVNAVDDLGCDPTGGDSVHNRLEDVDSGTLVEFPDGEYLFRAEAVISGKRIGFVGEGDVTFTVPNGYNARLLNGHGCPAILLRGITVDQQPAQTAAGFRLIGDAVHIEDVTFDGRAHRSTRFVENAFAVSIEDPDGRGVMRDIDAWENNWAHYGAGAGRMGIWVGGRHEGTLEVVNCDFREFGNNAMYSSRCHGDVQVRGCYFENNNAANVRIGGKGSFIEDSVIVVDPARYSGPSDREGEDWQMTGLVVEENFAKLGIQKDAGCAVRNCGFRIEENPTAASAIEVYSNGRSLDITGSDFEYHSAGDQCAIERHNYGPRGGSNNPAGEPPRHLRLRDCRLAGSADIPAVIDIVDGQGSRLDGVDIDWTDGDGDTDGVRITSSGGLEITNTRIRAPGRAIAGAVEGDLDDATPTPPTIRRGDGVSGGGGDGDARDWQTLVVRAGPQARTTYSLLVDGDAQLVTTGSDSASPRRADQPPTEGEFAEALPTGQTRLTGIVARGGGDTFRVAGDVIAGTLNGTGVVTVDGVDVDLAALDDTEESDETDESERSAGDDEEAETPTDAATQTLTIRNTSAGFRTYRFDVAGDVVSVPDSGDVVRLADGEGISAMTQTGWSQTFVVRGAVKWPGDGPPAGLDVSISE